MKAFMIASLLILSLLLTVALSPSSGQNDEKGGKSIAERITSPDAEVRAAAYKDILAERSATIKDLLKILNTPVLKPDGFEDGGTPRNIAISLLGEMRATEAIAPLMEWFSPPEPRFRLVEMYEPVAVTALIKIGKPASLECLKRLSLMGKNKEEGFDPERRDLLLRVIRKVEGDDVACFMLKNAIEKEQDKDKKANLTAALALLEKWIKEREELEKELKEKFPPKDQNPPAPGDKPANTNPLEDELKKGGPKEWEAALAKNDKERETIAKFLIERLEALKNNGGKEYGDIRKDAAVMLAKTRSKQGIDFLLANIAQSFYYGQPAEGSADFVNVYPCQFALQKESGWEKVPAILDYLRGAKRTEKELLFVSMAIETSPGYRVMLALLEITYLRPEDITHKKNVRALMDYIISPTSPFELTAEQRERQKLLHDKKIEYGQLPEEGDKKPLEKDKPESCPPAPTPMEPCDKPANP